MSLENSIKDTVTAKMEDGTVEKLVAEHVEKGIVKALESLFCGYGDVTKVIEKQIKSVMIPYLEARDYSQYIVKLDNILVDVLKNSALENKKLLTNFKDVMLPVEEKTIQLSKLYESWLKFVAEEVDTNGLKVICDDSAAYESVEVTMDVEYAEERVGRYFSHATLNFDCDHDKDMNFSVRLSRYVDEKTDKAWDMSYDATTDIRSLRYLKSFEILLLRLAQAQTMLILDTDSERDEVTPEKEPEAEYR